jgi:hypothetical protein
MLRVCNICKIEKELSIVFFYKKSDNKDGFEYSCKLCASLKKKVFRKINKERGSFQSKKYYIKNREKVLARTKAYQKNNSLKVNERKRNRLKIDPNYYLRDLVSRAVSNSLKILGKKKGGSILNYLEYTIDELKINIEKQFEPWMTWNNRGRYNPNIWDDNDPSTWTWNLDHIIPQASLPYTSMTDDNFKKCWALENLRPLSSKQNIIDGNRR